MSEESDVSVTSWVVLGGGIAGFFTVRAQHGFIVSLVSTLAEDSRVATILTRKGIRLLSQPTRILLYILWVYVIFSSKLFPEAFRSVISGLLALVALLFSPYLIYRLLRYAEFIAVFITAKQIRDPLLIEYLRSVLPFIVIVVSIVLGIINFLAYLHRAPELGEAVSSLFDSFVGIAIILGTVSLLRDVIGSITLLVDRDVLIGDIIQIRGVTGRVLRIGAIDVAIQQNGYNILHIPGSDFLAWPLINHSKAHRRENSIQLHFQSSHIQHTAVYYRDMLQEIKNCVERDPSVQKCSVVYLASGAEVQRLDMHVPGKRLRNPTPSYYVTW
eukprot:CAMPEP_0171513074 /NCGR_PEP_ID=MMETSP0959-20130129/1998_1 /TAXON_ID=87120 /ORGANISM="Aurantiochytrium limacinum, Strain ATCCMYA-1381" /LENGTH=328 /DNA_ID=CAMNT_0012051071 /DNA_START=46 /DNA_END=1029 /DNA_ORIENTATION=+